jgi:hypothetical protein
MEEADRLADDIIIMAAGAAAAAGTPLQLKARHGVGYSLTVVLSEQAAGGGGGGGGGKGGGSRGEVAEAAGKQASGGGGGGGKHGAAGAVLALVSRSVPGARLVSAAGCEAVLQLPREASRGFPQVHGRACGAGRLHACMGRWLRLRLCLRPAGPPQPMHGHTKPSTRCRRHPPAWSRAWASTSPRPPFQMLRALESARGDLGVLSYGLSVTTLEEVFLTLAAQGGGDASGDAAAGDAAVGSDTAGDAAAGGGAGGGAEGPPPGAGDELRMPLLDGGGVDAAAGAAEEAGGGAGGAARLSGAALYWQQLRALTIKRALCAR